MREVRAMRVTLLAALVALTVGAAAWAELPAPGDPATLTDLRWLARAGGNDREFATGAPDGVELTGPGVLDYLVLGYPTTLTIEVDGRVIFDGSPREQWRQLYVEPKTEEWGALPWAWPLVHAGGAYHCSALPIPFAQSCRVSVGERPDALWMSWRRLDAPPALRFGDDAYLAALAAAHEQLSGDVSACAPHDGAREVRASAYCPAGGRAELIALDGPGEVVGMRLRMQPGALDLLRHQVIELTIDGVTSVRMPLVDLVGVSHPWPQAWQPRAGDHAAGIVDPYKRSGGRVDPAVVAYLKLPIPFARSLRLGLLNRSERLTSNFEAQLLVAPLADTASIGRLCGTSVRVPLAVEGETELFAPPGEGRLVGLSVFATGHGSDWAWRSESEVALIGPDGPIASGFGLLPLGMQGMSGSSVIAALAWNHNSLQPTGRCGAGRHLWLDPIDLPGGSRIVWQASGADGPTAAEVGALWYEWDGDYEAPAIPAGVVELPTAWHAMRTPAPGGWAAEAEELASAAEASAGEVRAAATGALDVFASGDAYLAWNAERPGDYVDLPVWLPESRYARVWVHRLLFMAGGTFAITLEPPDDAAAVAYTKSDAGYLGRVLGRATTEASLDCYEVWPHRQAYRFDMPPMLNPAPGKLGRLRFTCITKPPASRGYLLAIDQLGIDPAPRAQDGWREVEALTSVRVTQGLSAEVMPFGRADLSGWGGRELLAGRVGEVTITLIGPGGPPATRVVELRGLAVEGEWAAGEAPLASPPNAKEPSVWRLPVGDDATLTIRCISGEGRLLLDAWRPAEE